MTITEQKKDWGGGLERGRLNRKGGKYKRGILAAGEVCTSFWPIEGDLNFCVRDTRLRGLSTHTQKGAFSKGNNLPKIEELQLVF